MYKGERSPDRRVMSLREDLANLACKLRHLVVHVYVWLLSLSYGHVPAGCDVVLLCRPWWHRRHGGGSPAVMCDVASVVVFVIAS
jgi:hypothetical protein